MIKKPPVIILKLPKTKKQAKKEYAERTYKAGPPASATPPHPEALLGPIERAKKVLGEAGVGEKCGDLYLLDGKPVTLGVFLRAANDLITRENMTRPKSKQVPLIGSNHHRWGQ